MRIAELQLSSSSRCSLCASK